MGLHILLTKSFTFRLRVWFLLFTSKFQWSISFLLTISQASVNTMLLKEARTHFVLYEPYHFGGGTKAP